MSGDVQPRKRKDKKKKKDDLGIEEPRGIPVAALGEGDIFMHSPLEHGTGGHWCAKVIFFSLLAVLVTLIGLIILENRGLSELEANSIESKYSGVLEGWLEDAHDGDHHDEHTLELNHHDDEDDDDDVHGDVLEHDVDEDHDDEHDDDEEQSHDDEDEENDHDDDDDNENQDDDEQDKEDHEENDDENSQEVDDDSQEANDDSQEINDDSQEINDEGDQNEDIEEQNLETAEEDEVEGRNYRRYYQQSSKYQANDDDDDVDDDDDLQKVDDDENNDDDDKEQGQINTKDEDDDENSNENDEDEAQENEDEDEHEEHEEEDSDVEVERIEKEVFDDDLSTEAPELEDDNSDEVSEEAIRVVEADEDEVEFLEPGDFDDLPDEMAIRVPKGKPLAEEEDISTETPQDTLADEEEYERQQETLRREKEETSQGMWLKLVVGGALLVATQAVLRRATAPREPDDEVDTTREETPLSDRRMTLIAEPVASPVIPKPQEVSRPVIQKEVVRQAPVVKSAPPPPPEEDEEDEEDIFVTKESAAEKDTVDKELYSDEEEAEDEEEEEEIIEEKKEPPKPTALKLPAPFKELPKPPVRETPKPIEKKEPPKPVEKEPTPEYEDDDVEIIEDEDIGEEVEEEEEDVSDVDDAELLTRLEAKYGRLPEPERPGRKTGGGNNMADEWPGEPSDSYWRDELDQADRDFRQGEWTAATERASAAQLRSSARARYIIARALDSAAEAKRDNGLLTKAIAAYLELLKMNERLSDKKLREVTNRALDRIQFRGNYLGAEPVYRLLIRRFPDDPTYRNNLTVSFLMANRVDLAEEVIKETLSRWPLDRIALAHHGFILKTLHNRNEEAVDAFTRALEGDAGPANEPRFYYHLGDSLLLLGRFNEAHEVHKRGAKLGHFLSSAQRSLYNVDRLQSKPWWDVEQTPYTRLARALEKSWKEILKEGQAAQELYEKEKEGLKERGEWSQLDFFVRGREVPDRCSRAPVTCNIVRSEAAAIGCRRGQVKFSSMEAGTHVRPHVGPTNCRLRMHLGLSNTKDTYIRVDQETRQWQTGKVLMFDDSFEHEVWHNGTGTRLVLIVDVWHPGLTHHERRQLPAI